MHRSSYREHDYAFGQLMLTLRTQIGLTQAGLAKRLGVSRTAVIEWEAGSAYPKAPHLKALIALGVQQHAFPAGREAEEIAALWQAAHQKLRLDETWLAALLAPPPPPSTLAPAVSREEPQPGREVLAAPPPTGPRVDWGEALAGASFYDRAREMTTLTEWVVEERRRVVSVLGMGGIGKSALATRVMQQVAPHFQVVVFRSLRDAPSCEALLADCLQVLAPEPLAELPVSLEARRRLLLDYLRNARALLVLDNLEVLLAEGEGTGRMRAGYEAYAQVLGDVAQSEHQSCLLLTSREKPRDLVPFEGSHTSVRSLRLNGLHAVAGAQVLAEKEVAGTGADQQRLVQTYAGNPLALKIVAETIVELFDGQVAPFLEEGEVVFGGVRDLLSEQFRRLSATEQTVLLWLAILREPVTMEELLAVLATPLARGQVLEAVEALRRRSLVERGHRPGSFTLHSVVLEYATGHLITELASEIEVGRLSRLIEHGLSLAGARDYVRQTQTRLLVVPLLAQLRPRYQGRGEVESRLLALLEEVRARADYAQGYGPANVLALLREERGHLRGLNLSQLVIRGAYLQGVELQDARLSESLIQQSVFTETFDAIWAVAVSRSGQYWAAGSKRGEVRVWREFGQTLHLTWQAHTDIVLSLAFSPDERLLASGSFDGSVKFWDVERGALLRSGWHTRGTHALAFAPDGSLLASGAHDGTIRLWDAKLCTSLQDLPHPDPLLSLAWSPDGRWLVSGHFAGTLRLWHMQPSGSARCVQTLEAHSNWVRGLAFAPDGSRLASASFDGTLKLWEWGEQGRLRVGQTLVGHTQPVQGVAWSPDGRTLASGSNDHTIRLWDVESRSPRLVLQGHSDVVTSLAFTPDSRHLLSGSGDCTLRLWEVERGELLRVLQGYAPSLYDLDWSPDGTAIASAGSDSVVSLWQVEDLGGRRPPELLRGHEWSVSGVGWRPDGGLLASSGWDQAIRLWDGATGRCVQVIRDRDHPDTPFWDLAWSPDGTRLASTTFRRGVLLWEVSAGALRWIGRELPLLIRRVAWSPDGTRLAGGGEDGHVYVWDAADGRLLLQLAGHQGAVMSVTWSQDGMRLASAGGGSRDNSGELFVWDASSGERLSALQGLAGVIYAVAWHPVGKLLISGGSDGRLRWWDLQNGECVREREAHQGTVQALKVSPDGSMLASCGDDGAINVWDLESGDHLRTLRRDRPYERMDISGVRGLTDAQRASLRALGAVEERTAPLTK